MRNKALTVSCLAFFGALTCFSQTQVPLNTSPSRIVGHPLPEQITPLSVSPNLVEGRELYGPQGIAVDNSVSPAILYVADTYNNRVLAWKNAAGFTNGQKADLVIGQIDFFHTIAQGPGTTFQTGLNLPSGLAVSGGDLYVADTGNNRILRYRKPFQQTSGLILPDLYIGQPNLNSRTVNNNGTGTVGAVGVSFNSNNQVSTVSIAFDSAGNLWTTDPGNRRVLRFAASDVAGSGGPLTANLLIGNLGVFTSVQPAITSATATITNLFAIPSALAFDPAGRLFVADTDNTSYDRVMVFLPPFSNSSAATRIMGIFPASQPPANQDQIDKTVFSSVNSIFFIPGSTPKVGLVDAAYNRLMLFDSYDAWPDPSTSYSPQATAVVGQTSFANRNPNAGTTFIPAASNITLYNPSAAVLSGNDLYVADSGNHRVVDLPLQGATFGPATRVLGQDRFDMRAVDLIEGKEFDFTTSLTNGFFVEGGITVDSSGDTPHLYVADYFNHRVLGFKDARSLKANTRADLVIGQQDFSTALCNGTGDPNKLSATTLCFPAGVLTDASGNLYVADSGNGRVLRFPAPFSHQGTQTADLVLGQANFTIKITDPTAVTMAGPYGLAFAGNNGLLVSDVVHNRVLFFPYTNGGFSSSDSGKAATKVLGQPNFNTVTTGTSDSKMNSPRHIAADSDSRPYVVDTGNNRVMIFDQINSTPNGASASHLLSNLTLPHGIYVSPTSGEVWVTNSNSGTVLRYPQFQSLLLNDAPIGGVAAAGATIAVTQDQYGDLIVADSSNRLGFYFPGLQAMNGGNFLPSFHLSPGMFASLCSPNSNCVNSAPIFGANTIDGGGSNPLKTSLDNVEVHFNYLDDSGVAQSVTTPLYYVSPTQINFYVPMGAPQSGNVDLEVVQTTTGRVYAASTISMATNSPAVLMAVYAGKLRQAQVLNQDNTINSPSNPAPRGSTISIYAVGQGFVPGAPADGTPAPSSPLLTTPTTPRINFGGLFTDQYPAGGNDPTDKTKFVSFSGLAPGYVGLWQINVQIPNGVAPGGQIPLLIQMGSSFSTDGSFNTTIAVK